MSGWTEKYGKENFDLYQEFAQYRSPWITDAVRYMNFRHNYHFSKEEISALMELRQPPNPVGITAAICETAEALMRTHNPIITVTPARFVNETYRQYAVDVAHKYESAVKSTWFNNYGSLSFKKVVKDLNNTGRGVVIVFPQMINGEFQVNMKHVSYLDFYPDPGVKDEFYETSDAMIISYTLNRLAGWKFARMYDPGLEKDKFISDFCKNEYIDDQYDTLADKYVTRRYLKEKVVRYIVRYTIEEDTFYYFDPVESDDPDRMSISLNMYKQVENQKFKEVPDEVMGWVMDGYLEKKEIKHDFLSECVSFGQFGRKTVYPIDEYNIVPFNYDWTGTPYPLGRVHYIYPIQRSFNKYHMLALMNASLANNSKWLAEENTILDKNNWIKKQSIPGVILQWKRNRPDTQPPVELKSNSAGDVLLQYPKLLQMYMEFVSGINALIMGFADEKTPSVAKTVSAMQSAGGERIKSRLQDMEPGWAKVGKIICKWYKEYGPSNGWLSWIEGYNKVKEDEYNTIIPDPNDPYKIQIKPGTDLGIGIHDLRFFMEPNLGYENAQVAQMFTLLATQLGVKELVPEILRKMNIPETEKIIKDMDTVAKANMTIQQQQQMIDDLEKRSNQLASQIEQKMYSITEADFKNKFVRLYEKLKNEFKNAGLDVKTADKYMNALNPNLLQQTKGEDLYGQRRAATAGVGESAGFPIQSI